MNYEFELTRKEIYESTKYIVKFNRINRLLYLSFYPLIALFVLDYFIDFSLLIFISIIFLITYLRFIIRNKKISKSVLKSNIAEEKLYIELNDKQVAIKTKDKKYNTSINSLSSFAIPNFNVICDIRKFYFLLPKNGTTNLLCNELNKGKDFRFWKYITRIALVFIFSIKIGLAFYNINDPYSGINWRVEELNVSEEFLKGINYTKKDSVKAVLVKTNPFAFPLITDDNLDTHKPMLINFRFEPVNKIRIYSIDASSQYGYNYVAYPMAGLLDFKIDGSRLTIDKWKNDSCIFKLVLKNPEHNQK